MARRRGRPAIDEDDSSVYVGVTLPSKKFDTYAVRAIKESVTIPEIIRRDLKKAEKRDGRLRGDVE